jgi:hypothetical protein
MWERKREVLGVLRVLRPSVVEVEEINWGLQYPGRGYKLRA